MTIRVQSAAASARMWVDSSTVQPSSVAQQLAHLDRLDRIEADRRLVEHQDRRLAEQRLRQADALAVALRQLPGQPVGHAVEAAARDRLVGGAPRGAPSSPFIPATKRRYRRTVSSGYSITCSGR